MHAAAPSTVNKKADSVPYEDLSDADLFEACRAGHQAAWSTLVRRYQRLVFTIPRRAGLSQDHAADVLQACFEKLYRQLDRIQDASRIRAWLVTTARRETLNLLDDSRRVVDLAATEDADEGGDPLDRLPNPDPLPESLLGQLQEQDRVRRALDRLDPRSRQLLEMLYLEEEPAPYAEIAARLGIAEGSIGPTRARSLAKLRTLLEKM